MKYSMYDHRRNVLEIQSCLRRIYFSDGGIKINPDGIFDAMTAQAIGLFQRQHGLGETGIVDYSTWQELMKAAHGVFEEK